MVKFTATKVESNLIREIVERVSRTLKLKKQRQYFTNMDLQMDLEAYHCNGNPLRLHDLLNADDFNLMHDVVGISRHIDRETGKLQNYFLPRFTNHERMKRA